MAVKRFSNSLISQSGQDKVTNFIAGYSPAIDEMDLIERVAVGAGGAANITFSNIPQRYQHLQIRYVARSSGTTADRVNLNINGDTTTSAHWHSLYGTGSSTAAYTISTAYIQVGALSNSNNLSSVFATSIIDIIDYSLTNKNKVVRLISGQEFNGSGLIFINSGARFSTDTVNSLRFATNTSDNFAQNSIFSLYGVVS